MLLSEFEKLNLQNKNDNDETMFNFSNFSIINYQKHKFSDRNINSPNLTVIIVCNKFNGLVNLLNILCNQTLQKFDTLIELQNFNNENIINLLKSSFPNFKFILHGEEHPCIARKRLAEQVTTQDICFIDSDDTVPTDYLEKLYSSKALFTFPSQLKSNFEKFIIDVKNELFIPYEYFRNSGVWDRKSYLSLGDVSNFKYGCEDLATIFEILCSDYSIEFVDTSYYYNYENNSTSKTNLIYKDYNNILIYNLLKNKSIINFDYYHPNLKKLDSHKKHILYLTFNLPCYKRCKYCKFNVNDSNENYLQNLNNLLDKLQKTDYVDEIHIQGGQGIYIDFDIFNNIINALGKHNCFTKIILHFCFDMLKYDFIRNLNSEKICNLTAEEKYSITFENMNKFKENKIKFELFNDSHYPTDCINYYVCENKMIKNENEIQDINWD